MKNSEPNMNCVNRISYREFIHLWISCNSHSRSFFFSLFLVFLQGVFLLVTIEVETNFKKSAQHEIDQQRNFSSSMTLIKKWFWVKVVRSFQSEYEMIPSFQTFSYSQILISRGFFFPFPLQRIRSILDSCPANSSLARNNDTHFRKKSFGLSAVNAF